MTVEQKITQKNQSTLFESNSCQELVWQDPVGCKNFIRPDSTKKGRFIEVPEAGMGNRMDVTRSISGDLGMDLCVYQDTGGI